MQESKKYKAVIIDDSPMNREILKEILEDEMEIVEIENGREACDYMMNYSKDISIVILDLVMPGMDGFEVLNFMKFKHIIDELPVIMITADNDEKNIEKAFDLGVIDFIFRPFSERVVKRRVLTTIKLFTRQRELITELDRQYKIDDMRVDELTGLDYKQSFFNKVYTHMRNYPNDDLLMIAIDIDNFKLFNNYYGWESGDEYLKLIARNMKEYVQMNGGIAGYLGGDDFALLCPNKPKIMKRFYDRVMKNDEIKNFEIGFAPKFGIYEIADNSESVIAIYDRALMALDNMRGDYAHRVSYYDKSMFTDIADEYELLVDIQRGMREDEFTFFAQPKVNMVTKKIVGAEALVRWFHRDNGMVSPGVFIPVLEKTGFIPAVDKIMWEKVCKWQRAWIDAGHEPLPISVNISRADIFTVDVSEAFSDLVQKYDLDPSLIEIEITESAYVEEYSKVTEEIEKLHDRGFKILMDDFGTGYSSLNSLKDLNIDVLKIDMKFLNMDVMNISKGVSILESIVNMARSLQIPTIMEGVETEEQVDFLTGMGVSYAQGFHFYRPMPVMDYENLLKNEALVDYGGIRISHLEPVHIREFLDENLFSDVVINNILGAVAFLSLGKGEEDIRIMRMNEQYCRLSGREYRDDCADDLIFSMKDIHRKDRSILMGLFESAEGDVLNGASANIRRIVSEDGETEMLHIRMFYLQQVQDRKIFYVSIEPI